MANLFTFQLIDELLKLAMESDTTIKQKSNVLLAECYCSWAKRHGQVQLKAENEEKMIVSRINQIGQLGNFYSKAQASIKKALSYRQGDIVTDSVLAKTIIKIAIADAGRFEEIAKLFKEAPIPDTLSNEKRDEYKAALKKKVIEAYDATADLLEEYIMMDSEIRVYAKEEFDKIELKIKTIREYKHNEANAPD